MTLSERLAQKRAEMAEQPQEQPQSSISEKLAKKRAEMNAPPPPIDYSNKQEIGSLPTADLPLSNTLKASGGLLLDSRPEAQINVLKEHIPDLEHGFDDEGRAFVTYKGKDYYLNKPGISGADINQFLADVVGFLPAGKVSALGKSMLARFGIGAGTYGATSAAGDLAANALGSKQDIDPLKAGVTAIFGGAAEAVTPFIIQGVRRLFSSNKLYKAGHGLTERGKEFVRELGYDPKTFNEAGAKEFAKLIDGNIDPKTAAKVAENKKFGIRLTEGEAKNDFNLIQKEDIARKGGFGERAQRKMQAVDDAKKTEMLTARDTLQSDIAGGSSSVVREVDGAGIVAEGIKNRSNIQKRVIDEAYNEAAQYDARLSVESLKDLSKSIAQKLKADDAIIDKGLTPATVRALKEVKDIAKGKNITAVTLKRLEATRRKLNNLIGTSANPSDKRNVQSIKNQLDTWMDDAFDRALFEGDEEALIALKNARAARRKYGDLFEKRGKGDIGEIQKLIEFDADENQALNYLFGRGKLGGKDSSTKVAMKVKEILGPDSAEWQAFKETAFTRLLKNTVKENNGKKTFNGQAFTRNFDAAMNDNPKLMKEIFGESLPVLKGFRNAVDRATFRPIGSVNTSGTGVALSKMAQESFKRFALMMGLSGDLTSYLLINGAAKVAGNVGKDFSKGVRPAVQGSPFAAALAAGAVEAFPSQLLQPSANNRTSPETK